MHLWPSLLMSRQRDNDFWNTRSRAAGLTAFVLLLIAGAGHRLLVRRIEASISQTLPPARPLATIPLEMGPWQGKDVPLGERVLSVANFDDQYINRQYVNRQGGRWVGLFVGYVGRPRSRLGHRPDVCYAAHGWAQVGQEKIAVTGPAGPPIPGILYEFRSPKTVGTRMLVLATYLINGRYSNDPDDFTRYNARDPGLFGDRKTYLTRVQISLTASADRESDVAALSDLAARLREPIASTMPHAEQ